METSVHSLIQESIEKNKIDLNSPYKAERRLLMDCVVESIDWTKYTKSQMERKMIVINKSINMIWKNSVMI